MGRLIDAEKLKEAVRTDFGAGALSTRILINLINNQETVPSGIKTGRWIPANKEGWECSECWWTTKKPKNFCPVCGSRNRKDEEKHEKSEKTR